MTQSLLVFFVETQESFPIPLFDVVDDIGESVADVFECVEDFLFFIDFQLSGLLFELLEDHKFFIGRLLFLFGFGLDDLLGDIPEVKAFDSVYDEAVHDFSQQSGILEVATSIICYLQWMALHTAANRVFRSNLWERVLRISVLA